MDGFHDRVITTLSGGEQQRAHFARILVQLACGEATYGPGVLLLDEPTASLDLRHQLDVIAADQALRRARRDRGRDPARSQPRNPVWPGASSCSIAAASTPMARPKRTITDAMLNRVFGVADAVGLLPAGATPFVLPHAARAVGREK